MSEQRRKWKNDIGDSHATVEALRAIAEELETHNGILDRGRGDIVALLEEIRDTLKCTNADRGFTDPAYREKARAERSNADKPEGPAEKRAKEAMARWHGDDGDADEPDDEIGFPLADKSSPPRGGS